MIPQKQNYIECNIGGQSRKIKMAMETSMKVAEWYLNEPLELFNPILRSLKAVYFGIDREENNLPDDFDEKMLIDWIDDMPQEEWDKIDEFTSRALGFMVAAINEKAEKMMDTLPKIKE
jgi:hypothetical protein